MHLTRCLCLFLVVLLSSPAGAQQQKTIRRIGFLGGSSSSFYSLRVNALRDGLHDLGYVEEKNIRIEYRYADGKLERLPGLVSELIGSNVELVIASSGPASIAAKNATKTIPIIFLAVGDPMEIGLVSNLARPQANITGLTIVSPELSTKRLELLKETFPKVARIAVLWNPISSSNSVAFRRCKWFHSSSACNFKR